MLVRLDGVEIEHAERDDRQKGVEDEDYGPHVPQCLHEHTLLLLLDVVGRALKPSDPQHATSKSIEQAETPAVRERVAATA